MAHKSSVGSSTSSVYSESGQSFMGSLTTSTAVSDQNVDWKERCQILESTLGNFKQQASKIRHLLAEKMKELEAKTAEAERKATEMEQMNKQLAERVVVGFAGSSEQAVESLQAQCREKDKLLLDLQSQLEDQCKLRARHSKAMEEKTSQIKTLISKKVSDLESENTKMKKSNKFLKHQVDVLRSRLQSLPVNTAREIHRLSVQDSDDSLSLYSTSTPPVPEKPSSVVLDTLRQMHDIPNPHSSSSASSQSSPSRIASFHKGISRPSTTKSTSYTPQSISPDSDEALAVFREAWKEYHEIDDNHQSKYEPKQHQQSLSRNQNQQSKQSSSSIGPPKVKIERRQFPKADLCRGSANSDDMLDDKFGRSSPPVFRTLPRNLHLNTCTSPLASPSKKQVPQLTRLLSITPSQSSGNSYEQLHQYSSITKLPKPYTNQNQSAQDQDNATSSQEQEEHDYYEPPPPCNYDSLRRGEGLRYIDADYVLSGSISQHRPQDDIQSLSNTSDAEASTDFMRRNIPAFATMPRRKNDPPGKFYPAYSQTQLTVSSDDRYNNNRQLGAPPPLNRSLSERHANPPTPPAHRLPSWEERIYAVADVGLHVTEAGNMANRQSSLPITDSLFEGFDNLTVPVYTSLKGRAARIRSKPFFSSSSSGSDSSDGIADESGPSERRTTRGDSKTCYTYLSQRIVAQHDLHQQKQQERRAMTGSGDVVPARIVAPPSGESGGDEEAFVSVAGPASQAGSSIKVRKQVSNSSSGAIKRATSSHSLVSESSSDYALPPDEVSIQQDSCDSEPEHKLLKYTARVQKNHMEKSGYLTKLGGKVKTWKRRWFVLKNGELLYFKSPNDVGRKPQGYINLDEQSIVNKTDAQQTIELSTKKKAYYLSADTSGESQAWFKVFQNVLRKQAADRMLASNTNTEIVKGWIIKTRKGRNRRCWCVLVDKVILFYKSPDDKSPRGQLNVDGARVEELERSCDSETDSDDTDLPEYTLLVWPPQQSPTYLMITTQHEKECWLYALSVASGASQPERAVGTEYEQSIARLMAADGDPACIHWSDPLLLHSKEPLPIPLSTLPSEELQAEATQLFKSIQRFIVVPLESTQTEQHVTMAQSILGSCQRQPQLQNELYCQLIKQTSPHPPASKGAMQSFLCGSHSWFLCDASSPTSPTNSHYAVDVAAQNSASKINPAAYVFIQGWQLIAMAISIFLPRQSVLWYLRAHLQRHANPRTDIGKYAVFCQRAVERATKNGARLAAQPSRMEVLSILLRHPYHHSQPISLPVHLSNATYQVVSFDGCTTVEELLDSLNRALGMRHFSASGFAIFTDNPTGNAVEHYLRPQLKVCDVISDWEQAYLAHARSEGLKVKATDLTRTVRFTYKKHMHFASQWRGIGDKEKLLCVYEVNENIVEGRFPLNRELAEELCALMAQIEFADFKSPGDVFASAAGSSSVSRGRLTPPHSLQQLPLVLDRFYPKRYIDLSPTQRRCLEQRLADKWLALRGRSASDCVRVYLNVARKWAFFGAKLFSAQVRRGGDVSDSVWLAVKEDSISLLHYASMDVLDSFTWKLIVTFGGCREDLMLVVKRISPVPGFELSTRQSSVTGKGSTFGSAVNTSAAIIHGSPFAQRSIPTSANSSAPVTPRRQTHRLLFALSKAKMLEITLLVANYINAPDSQKTSE